jgi:Xaa-Pro aminopeptidase
MEDLYPKFSAAEMQRRYRHVREAMEKAGVDCLVVAGSSSRWNEKNANIRYLSEFADKENMCSYLIVPLEGEPTLFIWGAHRMNNARLMSSLEDIRAAHPAYGAAVVDRIKELGLTKGSIGIDSYDRYMGIPHNHHETITAGLPDAKVRDVTGIVERQRLLKSPEEVEFMRKACELSDRAVKRMNDTTRPGMTDYEVYANIEHEIMLGGGESGFITLVGSTPMDDPDLPFPNIMPSSRVIRKGDIILTEITGRYGGYWGQTHKPLALGEPTGLYRELFEVSKAAYGYLEEQLHPGNRFRKLLETQKLLDDAGFVRLAPFVHGIGMEAPEEPVIGIPTWPYDENEKIREGMTFTVEPNPLTKDRKAACFLGDTFVVTKDGCECLNRFPPVLTVA